MPRRHATILVISSLAALSFWLAGPGDCATRAEAIKADALRSHIFFLASDALGGRHVGSEGFGTASEYVESQLQAAGVKPIVLDGNRRTYRMEVPLVKRTSTANPTIVLETGAGHKVFSHGKDFKWFLGDTRACEDKRLELVYVGYGISEPAYGWDDLAGVDLEGKAVLFTTGAPTRDGKPVLPEGVHELYTQIRSLMKKVYPIIAKRPAALLLIPDQEVVEMWDAIPSALNEPYLAYASKSPEALHLGCMCVLTPDLVEAVFAGQAKAPPGIGLGIPETTEGFALENTFLTLNTLFSEVEVPAWNLVGVVEGYDPELKGEYVAVTAHLDTNPPRDGEVMNGADDDASGCACLMEVAKAIAASSPRRSVVFALFTGEEGSVAGSRHFVSCCPVPIGKIKADVNLDGIGRSDPAERERTHFVLDSAKITPALTRLIENVNARTVNWPLKYEYRMGDSDHLMFHAVGIPAVNFYSGHHDDTNKPTDDPDKIDLDKAEKISRLVYEVTMELADRRALWANHGR